jgi:8-oxo-dGTP diphosphatase
MQLFCKNLEVYMNTAPDKHFVTVDIAIFTAKGEVLLIKRKNDPFKDHWALPGGFVDLNEEPIIAARRELGEETGLAINQSYLRISKAYNNLVRDPRGPVLSICYTGLFLNCGGQLKAGDDAKEYMWSKTWHKLPLAFDHQQIIVDALQTIRQWVSYI